MPNVGYAALQIIPSVRGLSNDLQRQIVGPAGDAGGRAGEAAGSSLLDKLKVGAAAAGVAAGALLVKGLTDAMGQADVTSKLGAQLGASSKDAAKFGKVAGKLYSSGVTDSFETAADTIKSVMQSGIAPAGATNKQLQAIATKASDVASIFGQDLGGVTNAVSQMMRTGLAKNSTEAFDLITRGLQSGVDKGGDFLDTLNEYGTQFRKAGVDGTTAIGLINQAIKGGARDSDVAADAIKEFSIRAVDGSKSTATGFKALGLNADDMGARFAKGGKAANGVLDLTLDKLRGVKDPVKQSQIAVQLFGTQAEDLGKALFAMDPSKAADGLGKVGGAAKKAGDTIRSGPSYEIQAFTRTLQQGFVDIIGGTVLPVVRDVVLWLSEHLGPAVRAVSTAVQGTIGWFRQWGVWLAPLAVLIGGITLALTASAIASGISAAASATWATVTGIATAVTSGWATAMGVLNAVMALNPFVLVGIALAALVAGLIIAYQKSETFRSIVQAAFSGIKAVALAVVGWFTGTLLPFFTQTIPAAFNSVVSWVSQNWPWILGALTGPIGLAVVYIVKHWDQVRAGFGAGWSWIKSNVLSPIRSFFTQTVPGWAGTLRDRLVGAFDSARAGIKAAWDKVKGIAKAPVSFIVNTVYNHGIVAMWNKVASAFGAPKLNTIKFATGGPVFGAGTETSDDVPAWLSKNEHVWTAKEVRGAGGHGAVMALRSWAAAGGRGALPGFKDGGGLFSWIGKGASKVAGWGSAAWDKVKEGASWLKDTLAASAKAGVNAVVRPLLRNIPGLGSGIGDMIAKIPSNMIDSLFGYAKKADDKGASDSFGGGKIPSGQHAAIIKRALSAAGVPPPGTLSQWLSGLNTLITRESGWNASAINRTDSNAKAGHPSQGLAQTIPGTFNAYVPASLKSRGILDPVANVAAAIRYIVARYGNITSVQQANASKSPKGYAGGGRPRAGETFWVGENGPELMRLGSGGATVWDSVTSMAMASGLGALRGFAKGTSSAKTRAAARKQIPGDLGSVHKVLTASAADIKKAFDELTKDLKAAGGSAKGLADSSKKASAKLQALAKQRDSVDSRLEAAKTAASDQKKTAADFLGLSNLQDSGSVADLIMGMEQRQSTLKAFQGTIAGLSKKGLSQDLISQLVAMGPESTLATLVSGANKAQLAQLNALAKSGAKLTTSYGNTMADAMFDAGKNASKGFLTGLKSQEKELQAAMNALGDGLVASIKKKLKIKSPSRVTRWVGEMAGAGVGVGLDATASTVAAAASRVADAAVPALPPAASSTAALGGRMAAGQTVTLVVQDGPTLRAYVAGVADGRVEAGLTAVRRKVRSRTKQ